MRYRYHYGARMTKSLEAYLLANSLDYKKSDTGAGKNPLVIIDIVTLKLGDSPHIEPLKALCGFDPIIFPEYSAKDLKSANYLEIRGKKQKIDIIKGYESYEALCVTKDELGFVKVRHTEQKGTITIAKEPPMTTKTAFWSPDTGFFELFADRRIYELAEKNSLRGVRFNLLKKKNGEYSSNLYQMGAERKLRIEEIPPGYGEKISHCSMCGKRQYDINHIYQLPLDIEELELNQDFYTTERIFGDGVPAPKFIISQRFYQLLKDNQLAGGLAFIPVIDLSGKT